MAVTMSQLGILVVDDEDRGFESQQTESLNAFLLIRRIIVFG